MDPDVVSFFIYLIAFVVSVVVIIAICQLFAIRRLLQVLVQQGGGDPSMVQRGVAADLPPKTAVLPARKFKDDVEKAAYLTTLDESSLLATWKANPNDALVEREMRMRALYVG